MVDRSKGPKKGGYGPGYGSKVLGGTVTESILARNGGSWKGYVPSAGTRLAGGFCVYCFDSGPSCARCGRVRTGGGSSLRGGSNPAPDESLGVSNGTRCQVRDEVRVSEPQVTLPVPDAYRISQPDRTCQLLTTASGSYRNRKVKTITLTENRT